MTSHGLLPGQKSLNFPNGGKNNNKRINKSKTTATPEKKILHSQWSALEKGNWAVNVKTVVKFKNLSASSHIRAEQTTLVE